MAPDHYALHTSMEITMQTRQRIKVHNIDNQTLTMLGTFTDCKANETGLKRWVGTVEKPRAVSLGKCGRGRCK